MYVLVCPWSELDGKVEPASCTSDAVKKFCELLFGNGWVNAKINEDRSKRSAIINVAGKRPFKIEQFSLRENDEIIERAITKIGKINVDAVKVTVGSKTSTGFMSKADNVIICANKFGAKKSVLLQMFENRSLPKIGFIDIESDEISGQALERAMKGFGAKAVFRR
jgi:hypothetical protein